MSLSTISTSDKPLCAHPSTSPVADRLSQDMTSFFLWPSFEDIIVFMVGIKVQDVVQSMSCANEEAVQSNLFNTLLCLETNMSLSSPPFSGRRRRCRSGDFSSGSMMNVINGQDMQVKKMSHGRTHRRWSSCSILSDLAAHSAHSSFSSSLVSSPRHSRNATWSYAITDSESDSDSDVSIPDVDVDVDNTISKASKFLVELGTEAGKVVDQQMSSYLTRSSALSSTTQAFDLSEFAQLQGELCGARFSFHVIDIDEECDVVLSDNLDVTCSSALSSTTKAFDLAEFSQLQGKICGDRFSFHVVDVDEECDVMMSDHVDITCSSQLQELPLIKPLDLSEFASLQGKMFGARFSFEVNVCDTEPINQSNDQSFSRVKLSAVESVKSREAFKLRLSECCSLSGVCEEDAEYQ